MKLDAAGVRSGEKDGWRRDRVAVAAGGTGVGPGTDVGRPPEQHFPVAVVCLHGLLAVATLVLVLLTALGVGS